MPASLSLFRVLPICLLLLIASSGCAAARDLLATPTGQEPTLQAISAMLTATAAAPTVTSTPTLPPTITPTLTLTPTPTVVLGMETMPGAVGEALEVDGLRLTVLSVNPRTVTEGRSPNQTTAIFMDVQVLLNNNGDQPRRYHPGAFQLVDKAGEGMVAAPNAPLPALMNGTLQPGESVWGNLTFRTLEDDNSGYRLRYTASSGSETTAGVDGNAAAQPSDLWFELAGQPASIPNTGIDDAMGFSRELPGVGARVEESGIALVVNQVTVEQRMQARKLAQGNIFLVLDVSIENVSRTRAPFNVAYFKVRSPGGDEWPAVIVPDEAMINAGSLGQGQQVQGLVAFEVPADVQTWMVAYQPLVVVAPYEEVRIVVETVD